MAWGIAILYLLFGLGLCIFYLRKGDEDERKSGKIGLALLAIHVVVFAVAFLIGFLRG